MTHAQSIDTELDTASLTGKRLGPYNSFNPVSRVQIWQWCNALGDSNPLYLDQAGSAVAPPAMMQMWTMRDVHMTYAPGSTDAPPYAVFDYLQEHGFPGNVAVSYDIEFYRYLKEGDRPRHYTTVVNISELKKTSLGSGYFVTEQVEYLDQDEQLFAKALITYFQYQPATQAQENTESQPSPISTPATIWRPDFSTPDWASLEVGQALPELVIPITHRLIVSGAAVSQDYIDVHHNAPAAQLAAMPDIFMNILTTCGLSGRYLTDWAGTDSRLKKLSLKLMAPNVPGDTMVMQGQVSQKHETGSEKSVEISFAGRNSRGFHMTGVAELTL